MATEIATHEIVMYRSMRQRVLGFSDSAEWLPKIPSGLKIIEFCRPADVASAAMFEALISATPLG